LRLKTNGGFCGSASKPRSGFSLDPQNQGQRFLNLGLKTGSSGLVIWALKSPRQFLCLGLKTGSSGLVIRKDNKYSL
jgi:hypothetical protein